MLSDIYVFFLKNILSYKFSKLLIHQIGPESGSINNIF